MGLSFVADAAIGEALTEGIVISTPHSCAGYPAIPQIKPDLSERTSSALDRTSRPVEPSATTTQSEKNSLGVSPSGAISAPPKSTTSPTRILPATCKERSEE
ncbi:MAG: hypothetical protein EB105_00320 [Actinobacteria bacterium]|nr:hypothetical protein [Actinomycetota bacterium]